jgi:3-dehydroquinate dehydratase-2
MKKIKIINGPNLNFLGKREEIYGDLTLEQIKSYTEKRLSSFNVELHWYHSNIEGEIVEEIQACVNNQYDGIVINPAAYSHTSVAIHDALKLLKCEIVEVHLTNVYSREDFRQRMLTAKAASKIMSGLGKDAYYLGVISIIDKEEE